MTNSKIRIYDTAAFRKKFMQETRSLGEMLKSDFGEFFIVPVEDMYRLMQLPVPPSKSTGHSCLFLTQGEAIMAVGTKKYTVRKNEFLAVPAGSVFSFGKGDRNKGFLLHFLPSFLLGESLRPFEFLQVWGNPHVKPGEEIAGFIRSLCRRLLTEYQRHGITNAALVRTYLLAICHELQLAYKSGSSHPNSRAQLLTNRFRELVFANVKTMHDVSGYAAKLRVSPNHLNKAVKAVTGKSPSVLISEAILLEAKVLLWQSELSINEIAAEVGHFDLAYFSRFFKKQEGISPSEFRRRIEKSK